MKTLKAFTLSFLLFILMCSIAYLGGSFMSASFDISTWSRIDRNAIAGITICSAIILCPLTFATYLDKNSNQ